MLDPQFRRDRFAATCAGYGFQPGTVAYAQCMQVEDIRWQQRFDASLEQLSRTSQEMQQHRQTTITVNPTSIHCTTNYFSGTAYTTCN
jgi:hypothetical protein